MPSQSILHALGLHLYQPADNLTDLLRRHPDEVGRILRCYERLARHAHKYAQVARLHVALSPVLLEQLRDPGLIEACRPMADIPAILDSLRDATSIEFIGSGLRHAPLPLIPPEDWDDQLREERLAMEAALGRVLKGYWPPAGLFVAEMIPALKRAGYDYVLLPTTALVLADGSGADPYRPYRLSHQGVSLTAIPVDAGFSQAQAHGLDAPWFADQVRDGVAQSPASTAPYLLTTWTDGENGEWFRCPDEEQGFYGQFFSPCMEFCETGEYPLRPVHLSEYLGQHPAQLEATLAAQPPLEQRAGLGEEGKATRARLFAVAERYWSRAKAGATPTSPGREALRQARDLLLRAEDSGYLLGDAAQRQTMLGLLDQAWSLLEERTAAAAPAPVQPVPAPAPLGKTSPQPRVEHHESTAVQEEKPAAAPPVPAVKPKAAGAERPQEAAGKPGKKSATAKKAASTKKPGKGRH